MKTKFNGIDKKLSGGGKDQKKLDMKPIIKSADLEKQEQNTDEMIFRTLKEKFKKDRKPGESFSDYIKRTPREELIRLDLDDGGKVVDIRKYMKSREPKAVKKISLSDYFDTSRTLESLTPDERSSLKFLLKKIYND